MKSFLDCGGDPARISTPAVAHVIYAGRRMDVTEYRIFRSWEEFFHDRKLVTLLFEAAAQMAQEMAQK